MESNVLQLIANEDKRQNANIELIASENFASANVLAPLSSSLNAKYAEGYPEQRSVKKFIEKHPDYVHTGNIGRYYGGCDAVDEIELYCRYMFQKAFHTDYHVNVQPHSGSQANMEAYTAILENGSKILAMSLDAGAHLTHSSPASFVTRNYQVETYGTDAKGLIDYDEVEKKALEFRPDAIVVGASAYPRIIDFSRFRAIADKVGAYMICDIAHIAGLVISGDHPTPFGLADIITTTTHKTFRACRGGAIFCKPDLAKKVDSAVFPRTQGGPICGAIASKAVGAEEACTPEYTEYIHQVVRNTSVMCSRFIELGYEAVTGGTDNHLFLLDFTRSHPTLTGRAVQDCLDSHNITLNKNCVPNETRSPKLTSGVRIGCAAMTTKGWKEEDAIKCADVIDGYIRSDLL